VNNRRKFLSLVGLGGFVAFGNAAVVGARIEPPRSKYLGKIQGVNIHKGAWPAYHDNETVIQLFGEYGAEAEFTGNGLNIDFEHLSPSVIQSLCDVMDKLRDTLKAGRDVDFDRCDLLINGVSVKVRCWCGQWQKNKSYDQIKRQEN
jgi:hypothetical protein